MIITQKQRQNSQRKKREKSEKQYKSHDQFTIVVARKTRHFYTVVYLILAGVF